MKSTILSIISIIIAALSSFAQLPMLPSSQLSPNATSLGEYGEVPVSLFSGIPQVEIPLYTIEVGDHQVPISLSYHGGGVKVDQHPGWTGLGWTLMAGGSICRTVNDAPDEYNNTTCNVVTYGNPEQMGYLWQHSMNGFNWDDPNAVNYYLRYYGGTYFETRDTEPDKFSFNFLGYSGNFYMDHNGSWKVQCDKDVKVELGKVTDTGELTDSFTMIYNQHTDDFLHHGVIDGCYLLTNIGDFGRSPSIKTFTLTAEDGTKYIFGGIDDAIEFSLDYFAQDQAQIVATSWNLIKIKYPDGREVEFNYQRGDFEAQFYQYQTYKSYSGGKTSFWWILP
ncbi:MAG: hypothetical protein J5784_00190, partial [Muribaculaceae bacterium]|nr:hypothetical protein [Muribaculaceae bacterium]